MQTALSLAVWSAWAPDKTTPAAWLAWSESQNIADAGGSPDISAIPAMQRRRLSSLSRMAFGTAVTCSAAQAAEVSCIFASRHGELARTIGILDSIVSGHDVSPTDFSHSVHNTALGLFSIFMKNKVASTQVVAGEDTFGAALIEAAIHRARFPQRPVLVVFFDEPLPSPLDSIDPAPSAAFSLALLFGANSAPNIGISRNHNEGGRSDGNNPGLDFLKFYLSGSPASTVSTSRTTWHWSRL